MTAPWAEKGSLWTVECEARTEEAALRALDRREPEVLGGVRAVAIDMSRTLESAVQARCPGAAVVYGRYHVSALLGTSVD